MSDRHLRIAHVIVQPVLVWDDGENLAPGPQCNPISVSVADLPGLPERLRADLEIAEQDAPDAES